MFIETVARALGTFAGNLDTLPGFHNNLSLDNKKE
jgi:hypothetical protein